jgi:hypothetical protein
MKNFGWLHGHLEYFILLPLVHFMATWQFCGHLEYFPGFGILNQETSGNPALTSRAILIRRWKVTLSATFDAEEVFRVVNLGRRVDAILPRLVMGMDNHVK